MFTHASAMTAAASRIAALPVSVRRKLRRGASRFRAHAVRPERGSAGCSVSTMRDLSAGRSEALGPDRPGIVSERHESAGHLLDEAGRPTYVDQRVLLRRPRDRAQHSLVDSSPMTLPARL